MKKIFKIIKFIPLLIVVSLLSLGSRIFGDDSSSSVSAFNPFHASTAEADVLSCFADSSPCDADAGAGDAGDGDAPGEGSGP